MAETDWTSVAPDPTSTEVLAASGLSYRAVDLGDDAAFVPYRQVQMRGFLEAELTDEQLGEARSAAVGKRLTGVFDDGALDPASPAGTIHSWHSEVSLPGARTLPMVAISGVTVSPTHRRRGIARAMLEGELRSIAAAGYPVAGLTVSEATIYSRFGFSPAAYNADWTVKTKRATWIGPRPNGRLDFLSRTAFADEVAVLHERVRPTRPGEVQGWPSLWRRMAGTAPGQDGGGKHRAIRYSDAAGTTRGLAIYRINEAESFSEHELELEYLLSETPDAYAGLWRFVLEHDLVSVVKAHLRSVDEPLLWMIADQRAAKIEVFEHQWLRILDVPTVLRTRTYAAAGSWTLRVSDPLGFAEGSWRLTVDHAGAGSIESTDDAPDASLSVNALASVLLGGVRPSVLATAGLVNADADTAAALDVAFSSPVTPFLSLWY